jgi:NIPSNAP
MTRKLVLLSLLMAGFAFGQNRIFELRTYTCNDGKLEALKTRFRDHTIEIFKRHGMESIGYWIPQDPEKSKTTLIYIIAHASREQATKNWREFAADPEWKKVATESEVNGKILARPPESVYMDAADFSQIK